MKVPVISIVLPAYNSEKTIENALDSILHQSFNDYEVLIIDGASTDRTVSIISDFSRRDERIKFITEKDNGIYDAMNKGIAMARGEWLYFMGSDDKLYNNSILETLMNEENINEFHVIYGNVYSSHFNGVYDGEFNERKLYEKNICHQAILLKKELFKITGLFNTRYKAHADWDHNLKWFLNPAIKKKYVNKIIADYAEGGYSSTIADSEFAEEKDKNFLKYGAENLDKDLRTLLYQSLANERKRRKDYRGYLKYKLQSYLNLYA